MFVKQQLRHGCKLFISDCYQNIMNSYRLLLCLLKRYSLVRVTPDKNSIFRQKPKQIRDRFQIHKLTNIDMMCMLVRTNKYNFTLNEFIILLYRLQQVFSILGKSTEYYLQFGTLKGRILGRFRDPDDYACLGTFALTLARLNEYAPDTWVTICEYILQRKYDDEHDQIFALIVAFEHVREEVPNDWVRQHIVQLYRQFTQVMILHVRQKKYNLKEMRKIVHCLWKYRYDVQDFWEEVAFWIKGHLAELEQKPFEHYFIVHQSQVERCMFDNLIRPVPLLDELNQIAYVLSVNGHPCLEFIQFAEKLINYAMKNGSTLYRHFQQNQQKFKAQSNSRSQQQSKPDKDPSKTVKSSKHHEPPQELSREYQFLFLNAIQLRDHAVIYFLYNFRRTLKQYPEYHHDRAVVEWIQKNCYKQYNRYNMHEIIILEESKEFLSITEEEMKDLVIHKLKTIRDEEVNMEDMKRLFDLVTTTNLAVLQPLVIKLLRNAHPAIVLKFTNFMEQHLKYVPQYFMKLPEVVNQHHKYFSFDQNCYFFYTLITNEVYWRGGEDGLLQYQGEMQKLKETIKVAAFSRGFKITLDSYFHKLLEYVNLADFFEGGN